MIEPNGCRWCGADKQSHLSRWQEDVSWHVWIMPLTEQIKQRMLDRRKFRSNTQSA